MKKRLLFLCLLAGLASTLHAASTEDAIQGFRDKDLKGYSEYFSSARLDAGGALVLEGTDEYLTSKDLDSVMEEVVRLWRNRLGGSEFDTHPVVTVNTALGGDLWTWNQNTESVLLLQRWDMVHPIPAKVNGVSGRFFTYYGFSMSAVNTTLSLNLNLSIGSYFFQNILDSSFNFSMGASGDTTDTTGGGTLTMDLGGMVRVHFPIIPKAGFTGNVGCGLDFNLTGSGNDTEFDTSTNVTGYGLAGVSKMLNPSTSLDASLKIQNNPLFLVGITTFFGDHQVVGTSPSVGDAGVGDGAAPNQAKKWTNAVTPLPTATFTPAVVQNNTPTFTPTDTATPVPPVVPTPTKVAAVPTAIPTPIPTVARPTAVATPVATVVSATVVPTPAKTETPAPTPVVSYKKSDADQPGFVISLFGGTGIPVSSGAASLLNPGVYLDAQLGFVLSPEWTLGLEVGFNDQFWNFVQTSEMNGYTPPDSKHIPADIFVQYHLNLGTSFFKPYLRLGAGLAFDSYGGGYETTDMHGNSQWIDTPTQNTTNPLLLPGMGLEFCFSDNFSLSLQAALDMDFGSKDEFGDKPIEIAPLQFGMSFKM